MKQYCDCGAELVYDRDIQKVDEYDNVELICRRYYCPVCDAEWEINEEVIK